MPKRLAACCDLICTLRWFRQTCSCPSVASKAFTSKLAMNPWKPLLARWKRCNTSSPVSVIIGTATVLGYSAIRFFHAFEPNTGGVIPSEALNLHTRWSSLCLPATESVSSRLPCSSPESMNGMRVCAVLLCTVFAASEFGDADVRHAYAGYLQ